MTLRIETVENATHNRQARNAIQAVFPGTAAFGGLVRLQLVVQKASCPSFTTQSLHIPFSALPKLRHFDLSVRNYGLEPLAEDAFLPPLQTLRLTRSRYVKPEWVADFLRRRQDTSAGEPFDLIMGPHLEERFSRFLASREIAP